MRSSGLSWKGLRFRVGVVVAEATCNGVCKIWVRFTRPCLRQKQKGDSREMRMVHLCERVLRASGQNEDSDQRIFEVGPATGVCN